MKLFRHAVCGLLTVLALVYGASQTAAHRADAAVAVAETPGDDDSLAAAICPIVYPVDQEPSERGYHYIFYGNGFFINAEGYLLTAAHVLSQLSDAQAYVLIRSRNAPPRLLQAKLIATDRDHDVALLRITPSPFEGRNQVRYLKLDVQRPAWEEAVASVALRPSRLKDPYTYDAFVVDHPAGNVLRYEFSQLDKGRPDTQLFLFGHEVLRGDSGAPVVSSKSQAVVGFVEGRWLRTNAAGLAVLPKAGGEGVAAAVPIHYAIRLLQREGVTWHSTTGKFAAPSIRPAPISLVSAAYPSQALMGGEVVLDALVIKSGELGDIRVVHGAAPFLEKALNATESWTFLGGQTDGVPAEARIGIVFHFAQLTLSSGSKAVHKYEEVPDDSSDHAAVPQLTSEIEAAAGPDAEDSLVALCKIDPQGSVTSLEILQGAAMLGKSVEASLRKWKFVPAKCGGANCYSQVILVVISRHGSVLSRAKS